MNKIWLFVIVASMSVLMFKGPELVLLSFSKGANSALLLSFELCAIYTVWTGIMKIVEQTGVSKLISKMLSPIVDFLFGKDMSPDAKQYVSLNISANFLGMGAAATPMGIKAIEAMDDKKSIASTQMIMLVILAATSLQFIPTTVIGLLTEHGSKTASSIIFPTLIASTISTVLGVFLVKTCAKIFSGNKRKKK